MKNNYLFKIAFFTKNIFQILNIFRKQGYFRSVWKWSCLDSNNQPIPWYTYPIIEYLKTLDLKDKSVFEFGSGNSTLWWQKKVKSLVSVEDDKDWYTLTKKNINKNCNYIFAKNKNEYLMALTKSKNKFDIIIVDGSHRVDCLKLATKKLKDDGFIILDNSDWYTEHLELIKEKINAIQVDFTGFGPINGYQWTTSIFFKRNFISKIR